MQPRLSAPRRGRGAEPLGDGLMLIKGMRAHVAAHGCCILCLLELDCRIQIRGMGGCEQLLIHEGRRHRGLRPARAHRNQPTSPHIILRPLPDQTRLKCPADALPGRCPPRMRMALWVRLAARECVPGPWDSRPRR